MPPSTSSYALTSRPAAAGGGGEDKSSGQRPHARNAKPNAKKPPMLSDTCSLLAAVKTFNRRKMLGQHCGAIVARTYTGISHEMIDRAEGEKGHPCAHVKQPVKSRAVAHLGVFAFTVTRLIEWACEVVVAKQHNDMERVKELWFRL